jgi:hypothetical protein
MAEAAMLPQALVAYTNADWNEEPFQFFTGSTSTPEDFTGASAAMGLRLAGATANAAELTTGDGSLTVTLPNEIGVTAPLALMSALAPGQYNFDLVVTYESGDVETLLSGQVMIVGGITPSAP